jgi:hypothetical protein
MLDVQYCAAGPAGLSWVVGVECTRTMTNRELDLLLLALAAFLVMGAFVSGVFHDWRRRLNQRRKYREAVFRRFGIITTPRPTALGPAPHRVARGERLIENGPAPPLRA